MSIMFQLHRCKVKTSIHIIILKIRLYFKIPTARLASARQIVERNQEKDEKCISFPECWRYLENEPRDKEHCKHMQMLALEDTPQQRQRTGQVGDAVVSTEVIVAALFGHGDPGEHARRKLTFVCAVLL